MRTESSSSTYFSLSTLKRCVFESVRLNLLSSDLILEQCIAVKTNKIKFATSMIDTGSKKKITVP